MKKIILIVFSILFLFSNVAMADSTAGKFGVTLRGGVGYFLNSEFTNAAVANLDVDTTIKGGTGWTAGTGFMYGITENFSVDFDIIYSQVSVTATPVGGINQTLGTGKTIDFSFGGQWRFTPKKPFVPYAGAGFDFMINRFDLNSAYSTPGDSIDVDNTFGVHLNAGADFFVTPKIALNAEFRYLYSANGDMTRKYPGDPDTVVATYSPSNFSGFAGVRFFFP